MSVWLVLAVALPWVVVALGCWVGYQIYLQHKSILERLETIETEMNRALGPEDFGIEPGNKAPMFELPDLDGNSVSIERFHGQPVLLLFVSPPCQFSRELLPQLAQLSLDGKEGRPQLLLVSTGEGEENRRFVSEAGLRCPVLLQTGDVAGSYAANGTPMGYLLDGELTIVKPMARGNEAILALARGDDAAFEEAQEKVAAQVAAMKAAKIAGGTVPGAEPAGAKTAGAGGKTLKPISESRINRDGLKAGTPAPSFTLPRLDGGEVSLEEYRGRRVLLIFSDPHCGPCDELAPKLERLHRRSKDLQVLMVSRGRVEDNRAKVSKLRVTFPVALQRQWEISRLYAKFGSPIGYLIDEEGVIVSDAATGPEEILSLASSAGARGGEKGGGKR